MLEALGRAATASPGPSGEPTAGSAGPIERPNAHDEVWIPIVFIVLVALCAEWALYQRDTVLRGWRAVVSRLRRSERSG